jgi:hypothetical protein
MPWSLDWFSAEALARAGSQIRRAGWTDKVLVYTGFWFLVDASGKNVVKATDFTEDEFRALDWTDQPYNANPCAAVPAYNTTPITYSQWTATPDFRAPPPPGFPDATA